jgi:hypothetical protein
VTTLLEDETRRCHYKLVALSIGSNDLCDSKLSCEQVLEDIFDLARLWLTKFGVTKIISCQILHRSRVRERHMRGLSLA